MDKGNVLILHGWEDNSGSGFIPALVKNFSDKGYNVVALDLPNPLTPDFDEWFAFAEDQIKNFDGKTSVIGHSMGGLLALKLAEKYPVDKLVLIAPVMVRPSEEYFDSVSDELTDQEMDIYKRYQDRDIDFDRIKGNSNEIAFIFGGKDPWITNEFRDFYSKNFGDVADIKIFDYYEHMSESEGVLDLPEVEDLF